MEKAIRQENGWTEGVKFVQTRSSSCSNEISYQISNQLLFSVFLGFSAFCSTLPDQILDSDLSSITFTLPQNHYKLYIFHLVAAFFIFIYHQLCFFSIALFFICISHASKQSGQ